MRGRKITRRKLMTAAIQVAPLLLALFWCWFDPAGIIARQRRDVFDYYQRLAPRSYQDAPVRIVDIDDASLAKVGQWPWPRSAVAAMVARLSQAGAAAIAFDVIFSEPDRTSPAQAIAIWSANGASATDLGKALAALPDHDALLAKAINQAGRVVTGFALTDNTQGVAPLARSGFATLGDDPKAFVPSFKGAITDLPEIERAGSGNGSVTFTPDDDFIIRRVPLVERLGQALYPSLAAEALRVAQSAHSILIKSTGANGEFGSGNQVGVVSVRIGDVVIPTDARGELIIHYTPYVARRVVPAWQVFTDGFDPSKVRGTIVLIGTSATGLRDIRPSPINPTMSGVEAHAQALEQMLLGHYLQRPDWAPAAEFCFVLIVGSLIVVLLSFTGAIWSGIIGLGAIVGAFAASWHVYIAKLMLFDPVTPSVAVFAVYLSSTIVGYLRTETEKRQVRGAFGRYLSPDLVEELTKDPDRLKLGGDLRVMTFMFCDVRGFTRISERFKSNPQGLTRLLNSFLTPMTDIILARRGTIDKYMGDCIMAFWNAPLDDPDHGKHACSSALAMIDALDKLNEKIESQSKLENAEPVMLRIGIGINTGECVVGNMGSDQRFDYSVLGDAVNLASRLEGQSKVYGVDLVISETTRAIISDWAAIELDLIVVKGKAEAVRIYTFLGDATLADSPKFLALNATHQAMLGAYRNMLWDEARAKLDMCRQSEPRLAELYDLYAQRIDKFRLLPPPPEWAGVHVATEK